MQRAVLQSQKEENNGDAKKKKKVSQQKIMGRLNKADELAHSKMMPQMDKHLIF